MHELTEVIKNDLLRVAMKKGEYTIQKMAEAAADPALPLLPLRRLGLPSRQARARATEPAHFFLQLIGPHVAPQAVP